MVTALAAGPAPPPASKRLLARIYGAVGLGRLDERASRSGPIGFAVNYHHTPAEVAAGLDRQLAWFRERYVPLDRAGLDRLLAGRWDESRPGLMIHLDDGFADHADVAAPLLERHGFTGWFHVVTDRVDAASAGRIDPALPRSERSMTWDKARDLRRRGHEICSHTCGHVRMRSSLRVDEIAHEILDSAARIAVEVGESPVGFCWPGGEADAYDPRALALVMRTYRYAFPGFTRPIRPGDPAHAISRSNVEATWDIDVVRLSMGKLWEIKHRRRASEYWLRLAEGTGRSGPTRPN